MPPKPVREPDPALQLSAARVSAFVDLMIASQRGKIRRAAAARRRLETLGVLVELGPISKSLEVPHA